MHALGFNWNASTVCFGKCVCVFIHQEQEQEQKQEQEQPPPQQQQQLRHRLFAYCEIIYEVVSCLLLLMKTVAVLIAK
jgi:hypothetical protein